MFGVDLKISFDVFISRRFECFFLVFLVLPVVMADQPQWRLGLTKGYVKSDARCKLRFFEDLKKKKKVQLYFP